MLDSYRTGSKKLGLYYRVKKTKTFQKGGFVLILFLACSSDRSKENEDTSNALTYYRDIQPIMEKNCLRCHLGKGPGVGDFSSPEEVQIFADLILNAIDDNRMPPPAADPSCREYIGSEDMTVTQEDRNTIAAWIDSNKEIGDPNDAVAIDLNKYTLQDGDLEVTIAEPYIPQYEKPEDLDNEYRCFVLEHGRDENFYIEALYPQIDNAGIVHHIVLAKAKRNSIIDGADRPEGIDCLSGAQDVVEDGTSAILEGMIAAWAPGAAPIVFENAGILIQSDDVFVLQMHYYKGGTPEGMSDQSGYIMKTTDSVEKTIMMGPYGYEDFLIPAGESEYSYVEVLKAPTDFMIWATFPHMHLLGTGYRLHVVRADSAEEECIVQSEHYDFNNQLTYQFTEPVKIYEGDEIYFECTWDNSAENPNAYWETPQDVGYGERTDQEMCYAFTLLSFGH